MNWTDTATQYRGANGATFTIQCPAGGQAGTVWGTDVYSDDSSLCTAALHAGRISLAGGQVTIEIRGGESQYIASTRNGVTTRGYGSWSGSFVVR